MMRPRLSALPPPPSMRILVLSVVLLLAVTGSADAAPRSAREVRDDLGHEVQVPAAPLRIVSLAPGATESLFAAGGGEQVIATVEYSDQPPAALRVPRIGDASVIDLERLVALRPDVVVAWPGGGNPAQRAKIATLNIPIFDHQVAHLSDLPGSLERLGALTGTPQVAARAAGELAAQLAELTRRYAVRPGAPRPSVLLQVWNRPIYTVGGRQLMSDALSVCGARNVFADLPEASPLVNIEAVIARNPDIIVAAAPPGEGAAWVADWQRFAMLGAVKAQRVVSFEDQGLSRLGPSVLPAAAGLCELLARLSRGSY